MLDDQESDHCVWCFEKYNRLQPSFCQCNHCSTALCFECANEHHEEVVRCIAELSNQYNDLQQLFETKKKMIDDEVIKSVVNIDQHFDRCIDELRQMRANSKADLDKAKADAEIRLSEMNEKIQMIGIDIRTLFNEYISRTKNMQELSSDMKLLEEQLHGWQTGKTEDQSRVDSKISQEGSSLQPAATSTDTASKSIDQTHSDTTPTIVDIINETDVHSTTIFSSVTTTAMNLTQTKNDVDATSNDSVIASFYVSRMASDGENIMYASHFNRKSDRLAYCLLNNPLGDPDNSCEWNPSSILDMIWWKEIDEFICATEKAIYAVDYSEENFKIRAVIRNGGCSYVGIAANSDNFFFNYTLDESDSDDSNSNDHKNIFAIYKSNFRLVKTIDAAKIRYFLSSISFCATDHLLASVFTHKHNSGKAMQINVFDLQLNQLEWLRLGSSGDSVEIRTDDDEGFFIATGTRKLHIVSFNASRKLRKKTIELKHCGICIAILDNRRIAVSGGGKKIELISY